MEVLLLILLYIATTAATFNLYLSTQVRLLTSQTFISFTIENIS